MTTRLGAQIPTSMSLRGRVDALLPRLGARLGESAVSVDIDDERMVRACGPSLDSILAMLMLTAARRAPAGAPVELSVQEFPGIVCLKVADRGGPLTTGQIAALRALDGRAAEWGASITWEETTEGATRRICIPDRPH